MPLPLPSSRTGGGRGDTPVASYLRVFSPALLAKKPASQILAPFGVGASAGTAARPPNLFRGALACDISLILQCLLRFSAY